MPASHLYHSLRRKKDAASVREDVVLTTADEGTVKCILSFLGGKR